MSDGAMEKKHREREYKVFHYYKYVSEESVTEKVSIEQRSEGGERVGSRLRKCVLGRGNSKHTGLEVGA